MTGENVMVLLKWAPSLEDVECKLFTSAAVSIAPLIFATGGYVVRTSQKFCLNPVKSSKNTIFGRSGMWRRHFGGSEQHSLWMKSNFIWSLSVLLLPLNFLLQNYFFPDWVNNAGLLMQILKYNLESTRIPIAT